MTRPEFSIYLVAIIILGLAYPTLKTNIVSGPILPLVCLVYLGFVHTLVVAVARRRRGRGN